MHTRECLDISSLYTQTSKAHVWNSVLILYSFSNPQFPAVQMLAPQWVSKTVWRHCVVNRHLYLYLYCSFDLCLWKLFLVRRTTYSDKLHDTVNRWRSGFILSAKCLIYNSESKAEVNVKIRATTETDFPVSIVKWIFIVYRSIRKFPVKLTHSTVQSPSWAANRFAASQEIPPISRNPKVHYRIHKRPQPVSILGQPNPVHIPTSHLLEIHPNIIHPSMSRSSQWSPSLQLITH